MSSSNSTKEKEKAMIVSRFFGEPIGRGLLEDQFQAHGLNCEVILTDMGHRCGYVGVPKGHPAFGKHYDDLDFIDVHGGLTYSRSSIDDSEWVLGFDCAHYNDYTPMMAAFERTHGFPESFGLRYWNREDVAAECGQLAEQLSGMTEEKEKGAVLGK